MLQNPCKTLGFKKNMVWGGGKPYPASGLVLDSRGTKVEKMLTLAPERYTAGFCMVEKVILRCI